MRQEEQDSPPFHRFGDKGGDKQGPGQGPLASVAKPSVLSPNQTPFPTLALLCRWGWRVNVVTPCPEQGTFRSPVADGTRGGRARAGAQGVRRGAQAGAVYLQWWARSGLMLQHLGHLYTTCPGFSCKLSMNSLVAFPLGTAPCKKERCQGQARGSLSSDIPQRRWSFESSNSTHGDRIFSSQRHVGSVQSYANTNNKLLTKNFPKEK